MYPKLITLLTVIFVSLNCGFSEPNESSAPIGNTKVDMTVTNEKIKNYKFLKDMYSDDYFPKDLVKKIEGTLIELCVEIEAKKPKGLDDLYLLTHEATEKINDIAEEFYERESEIETVARDTIGMDFEFIASSYGYEADTEELIAPRDW